MTYPSSLITLGELSRLLRLPKAWLRSEAKAKRIPCLDVGRRPYFCFEAVKECLTRRASTSHFSTFSRTQTPPRPHLAPIVRDESKQDDVEVPKP